MKTGPICLKPCQKSLSCRDSNIYLLFMLTLCNSIWLWEHLIWLWGTHNLTVDKVDLTMGTLDKTVETPNLTVGTLNLTVGKLDLTVENLIWLLKTWSDCEALNLNMSKLNLNDSWSDCGLMSIIGGLRPTCKSFRFKRFGWLSHGQSYHISLFYT